MPTQFTERLTIILPVARVAAFGSWFRANIDPNDDCSTWPALNAAGDAAVATHVWSSGAYTMPQLKLLMRRLCAASGVTEPAGWDSFTRAQKRQWLLDNRGQVRSASGIWVGHCDNDGVWERFDNHLDTMTLKRRKPPGDPV